MIATRAVYSEINLVALRRNTAMIRRLIGDAVRLYGVVKGDAYGIGVAAASPVIVEAGADAIATADPHDIPVIRRAGVRVPILLYPSTPPDLARDVAELGARVSLHDKVSIEAFASQGRPVQAHFKIDCGFGRFGLSIDEVPSALVSIRRARNIELAGLYTHLAHTENAESVVAQMKVFKEAVNFALAEGFADFERMVASTRVLLGYRDFHLNAVNPGRGLYGLLEKPWTEQFAPEPVVTRVTTRVLQTKILPKGALPGYLSGQPLGRRLHIAVIAGGFANGLPRMAKGMPVLIRGQEAPTLGMRSTEHMVVDVSAIPNVVVGDEAVIIGNQCGAEISADRFADISGIPLIEALPRITRSMHRRYR